MDGRRKREARATNFLIDLDSTPKNMDGVESNMVLEVPDTPDRLAMRRPVDVASKISCERNSFGWDANPNCDAVRTTHVSRCRQPSHHNLTISSIGTNDDDFFFNEASLARQLSGTPETRPSSTRSVTSRETIDLTCKSPVIVSDHTGSRVSFRMNGHPSSENGASVFEHERMDKLCGDNMGLKSRDKGKGIVPCSNPKFRSNINQKVSNSVNGEMNCSSTRIGDRDNAKGKDPCGDSALVNGLLCRPRSAQRRLVRNGRISPLNIERSMKQKGSEVRNSGSLSNPVPIVSPDSHGKNCDKLKGIATVEDGVAAHDGSSHSSSGHMLPGKEAAAISDGEVHGRMFEDEGWRTTRNHISKPSRFPARGTGSGLGSENPSNSLFGGTCEFAMANGSSSNTLHVDCGATVVQCGASTIVLADSQESQRENGRVSRKRKVSSSHSLVGECSSSIPNDPESLHTGSHRRPLNTKSTITRSARRDGLMLGPVVEVEELQCLEAESYSVDRDRQVESDEMLARQLQEELYNEIPRTDEIDASIAMLLQENNGSGAGIARHRQSRRSGLSNLSTRTRVRQAPMRGRSRARAPMSSRMAQLRREFYSEWMDLNTRFDIDEAVGFGDDGGDAIMLNTLHTQRDFNENDYETLLQLDENNHQHGGASERQINSLPQSVIQNADLQEACSVCLEPPAVGDTIRHLPCLHKFHKDCIDAWLRRKRSCPICKSDVR